MYLIIILIYLLFVFLVVFICHRSGMGRAGKIIVTIALLLAPFWELILQKGIMWNYSWKNKPLQKIIRTVERPDSVLWIDRVWPGFDEYGRHWMVNNYLDGIHLQKLALNGDDGKIYLYQASADDFSESEKIRPEHDRLQAKISALEQKAMQIGGAGGNNRPLWKKIREDYYPQLKALGYEQQRKKEIDRIFSRPMIFQRPEDLGEMHFRIELKQNRLPRWEERFVWCDEIRIHDNIKQEDIAFSKRCLGYSPKIGIDPIGGTFTSGTRLGDEYVYEFDDKVLFGYGIKSGYDNERDWKFYNHRR